MPALRNSRHELFCQLLCGSAKYNGAQAYRKVGYTCKTADYAAHKAYHLRNRADVQKRMAEILGAIEQESKVQTVNVLECLNEIAAASMGDFVDFDETSIKGQITFRSLAEVPENLRAVIQKLRIVPKNIGGKVVEEVQIELYSRVDALKLLGKNQRLFVEKHELSNPDGSNLGAVELHVHFTKPDPE